MALDADVTLRLQPCDFLAQAVDLLLLGLHLPKTGKGVRWVTAELPSLYLKPPVPSKHLNSLSVKSAAGRHAEIILKVLQISFRLQRGYS